MVRATRPARSVATLLLTLAVGGCGAKTGLEAPDVMDLLDSIDAGDVAVVDVPVRRPARCFPTRVHTRLGYVTSLRPDTDVIAPDGYTWTLRSRPEGSHAELFSDGSDVATITPDRVGEYEIDVSIATFGADGGSLRCTITLVAEPPDPRCPGYALVEPRVIAIPNGSTQVAFDIAWGQPRTVTGIGTGAIVADDPVARTAAVVIERATTATGDPNTVLQTVAIRNERAIERTLSATPVFVGRTGTSHEGLPIRRSAFRIVSDVSTTPGALRDQVLRTLSGLEPVQDPAASQPPASSFHVEVLTMVRPEQGREIVVVVISPAVLFDDATVPTGIRVNDVVNATAMARIGRSMEVQCHAVTATRSLMADFLWLVDTSPSMNDDQQRVGRTAERFFLEMNDAGLDFRVGVMQAGSRSLDLTRGGGTNGTEPFRWIPGPLADGSPNLTGAQEMAWQVTDEPYAGPPPEPPPGRGNLRPFRVAGYEEEPLAAAVLAIEEFERRQRAGETNREFVLRDGATRVVFLVTDEPGTNDYTRFFAHDPARWGSDRNVEQLVQNIARFFTSRNIVPFGMVPVEESFTGVACPTVNNLPACVITTAGGAYIPIEIGDVRQADRLFTSAMARVVDVVAGAASEFTLSVVPISSSLRARVDGRLVPRSRFDGFDYEDRSQTLVFRGATFRPRRGQQVRVAYFRWAMAR